MSIKSPLKKKKQGSIYNNQNQQQNQDFGNQSSILPDEQAKNNKIEITNASLNLLEDIDSKWMELKITGKNVQRRSYHSAVVYDGEMYIYGGYDVNTGILQDFWKINLEDPEQYIWKNLTPKNLDSENNNNNAGGPNSGYPGPRERHQAVVYNDKMYIFGGLKNQLENTNTMHSYCFQTKSWQEIEYTGDFIPKPIDSHSMVVDEQNGKFLLFGGFLRDDTEGGYENKVYSFDLNSNSWEILQSNSEKLPKPRSGASICFHNNRLFMFGGSNVTKKFNDFWYFENGQWNEVEQQAEQPESRNGHSLILYEGQILLFGGIHDITHEKNDLMLCDSSTLQWKVVDIDTSHKKEEGDSSPRDQNYESNDNLKYNNNTQKKLMRTTNHLQPDIYNKKKHQTSKRLYQTQREKNEQTIMNNTNARRIQNTENDLNQTQQQKHLQSSSVYQHEENTTQVNQIEENKRRRQEMKKKVLLDEFKLNENEVDQFQSNSPTTIAMKNSIISVGNPQGKNKYDLKSSYKASTYAKPFDFRSNKIIGKSPSARDGQTAVVYENYCIIFGGDRHLMAYNDIFQMDLEMATGIKLPERAKKEKKVLKELEEEDGSQQQYQQQQQQQQISPEKQSEEQQQQEEPQQQQQQQSGEGEQQQQQNQENDDNNNNNAGQEQQQQQEN